MAKAIYEFRSYKEYLVSRAGGKRSRRGEKIAIAKAAGCQPTYVSQVLYGRAHLSLEQAERLNAHLHHTKEESLFFLLLVQKDRAGTKPLERFFQEQMDAILAKRLVFTERLGAKHVLSLADQATYYSSWQYAAVHIALTVPSLQTKNTLSAFFNITITRLSEVLDFLVGAGLAEESQGKFRTGSVEIRLGKDSPNIIKHHTNWRQQAIESLEREDLEDLHYSGVVSLTKESAVKVKNILLDAIRDYTEVVRAAKEEELCCLNVDFFNLKKRI